MIRTYIIYKIICPDGRSYVGCTSTSVAQRVRGHASDGTGCYASRLNPNGIGPAITRFGLENCTVEELASTKDPQAAAELETQLIAEHGTLYPEGYNLRARSAVRRGVQDGAGRSLVTKPAKIARDYIWINSKAKTNWPMSQWGA